MRLALRLTIAGWRLAPWRLALSVVGVAAAVAVSLAALSLDPALQAQRDRELRRAAPINEGTIGGGDRLFWRVSNAEPTAAGELLTIAVASTGPAAPLPIGAPLVPKPGEVLVSPAFARLIDSDEGRIYRMRLPGPVVGRLHRDVLSDPNDLVMMVGAAPEALRGAPGYTAFSEAIPPSLAGPPTLPRRLLIAVASVGLALPILAFVHASLLVSARRREERLAALRLAGATARDVRRVVATEVCLAAAIGTVLGIVMSWVFRLAFEDPTVAGTAFFSADLAPRPLQVLVVAMAAPVVAGLVAWTMMRTVESSPLGVRRRAPRRMPTRSSAAMFLVGWIVLVLGANASAALSITSLGAVVALGFTLVITGFIAISPALIRRGTGGWMRRRPESLLAKHSLAADPTGAARAVGGIAVAALVAGTALTYFPSHHAWVQQQEGSDARPDAPAQGADARVQVHDASGAGGGAGVVEALRRVEGVADVVPVVFAERGRTVALASCSRLLRTIRAEQPCDPSASYAGSALPALAQVFPPIAELSPREIKPGEQLYALLLATDGRPETPERVRAAINRVAPAALSVSARTDRHGAELSRNEADQARLGLAAAFMFAIGWARFLLALVEGILVRRRTLSMLIAQGTGASVLRWAAVIEFGFVLLVLTGAAALTGVAVGAAVLATAGIPPAVAAGDVVAPIGLFAAAALVSAGVAAFGVGRQFDVRALAGERA